jgi:hypothetical protein
MISQSKVHIGFLVLLFLSMSACSLFAQTQGPGELIVSSHALDGRTYFGQNGSKGEPADHDDVFIFDEGMFRSTSCDEYGFTKGRYEATEKDGVIYFKSITESPTHGRMAWEGKVDHEALEGTFVWTKERWYWDIRKEYWFNAELKK